MERHEDREVDLNATSARQALPQRLFLSVSGRGANDKDDASIFARADELLADDDFSVQFVHQLLECAIGERNNVNRNRNQVALYVDLSFNSCGERVCGAINQFLNGLPAHRRDILAGLNIASNPIGDTGVDQLVGALEQGGTALRSLAIGGQNHGILNVMRFATLVYLFCLRRATAFELDISGVEICPTPCSLCRSRDATVLGKEGTPSLCAQHNADEHKSEPNAGHQRAACGLVSGAFAIICRSIRSTALKCLRMQSTNMHDSSFRLLFTGWPRHPMHLLDLSFNKLQFRFFKSNWPAPRCMLEIGSAELLRNLPAFQEDDDAPDTMHLALSALCQCSSLFLVGNGFAADKQPPPKRRYEQADSSSSVTSNPPDRFQALEMVLTIPDDQERRSALNEFVKRPWSTSMATGLHSANPHKEPQGLLALARAIDDAFQTGDAADAVLAEVAVSKPALGLDELRSQTIRRAPHVILRVLEEKTSMLYTFHKDNTPPQAELLKGLASQSFWLRRHQPALALRQLLDPYVRVVTRTQHKAALDSSISMASFFLGEDDPLPRQTITSRAAQSNGLSTDPDDIAVLSNMFQQVDMFKQKQ